MQPVYTEKYGVIGAYKYKTVRTAAAMLIASVAGWQRPGEEGGMVARFQPPTKLVVAQFLIFQATAGTFLSTFRGLFEFLHCTEAGDLLLTSGSD